MAAREESTSEGGLSARCISLLEEVKEIIKGRRDPATSTTTNGDGTSARRHGSEGHKHQRFLRWISSHALKE